MTNAPERDLASLSVDELTQGLQDPDPAAQNSVEAWIMSEGYYPGSARVQASDLYAKYAEWLDTHPGTGRRHAIRSWGKIMVTKFKMTRGKTGSSYYISRENTVDVVEKESIQTRTQAEVGSDPPGGVGTR